MSASLICHIVVLVSCNWCCHYNVLTFPTSVCIMSLMFLLYRLCSYYNAHIRLRSSPLIRKIHAKGLLFHAHFVIKSQHIISWCQATCYWEEKKWFQTFRISKIFHTRLNRSDLQPINLNLSIWIRIRNFGSRWSCDCSRRESRFVYWRSMMQISQSISFNLFSFNFWPQWSLSLVVSIRILPLNWLCLNESFFIIV